MTATIAADRPASPGVDAPPAAPSRLVGLAWLAGSLAVVTAGYCVVALRNRGFFLVDDNESAILPMFSHIGHELREGTWPGTSTRNWTVGLVAGDPQYAMYNPLSLLSYWAVEPLESLVWRLFLIVLLWVNLLSAGVYWAARSVRVSPPFAALAAVVVGLNLFVLYWQAAGWTTILPGVAWFAVATAALLAALDRLDRPWRAVLAGLAVAFLVAGGSPFALQAFVLAAAVLVGSRVVGARRVPVRRLGMVVASGLSGAVLGAVPWVVSLAYVESTRRQGGSYNNGFLTFHLESLLMSFTPSVRPFTGSFRGWGNLDQPVTYGSWLFAGAVAVAIVRRIRLRPLELGVLAAGVAVWLLTVGPEHLGPFRWPFRLLPFAMILLTIAMVVVLERAFDSPARPSRDRRPWLAGTVVVLAAITFLLHASVVAALVTAVVLGAGVPLVVWCVRRRRPLVLVGAGIVSTFVVWVAVVALHPRTTDLIDLGGPGDIAQVHADLQVLSGHRTLQLLAGLPDGDIRAVLGQNYSLYGIAPAEVINGYTSLVPIGLGDLLCLGDTGFSCPRAATDLFQTEPETGRRIVDLLGVTQIMVARGPILDAFEAARSAEWQPAEETEHYVLYRNGGVLGADPIVWASEGVTVDGDVVTAPAGGSIVLSRPLQPGTTVAVGDVDAELDDVDLVFVRATFDRPVQGQLTIGQGVPGARAAVITAVAGVLLLAGCAVAAVLIGRRRRDEGAGAQPAAGTTPVAMNSL